MYHSSVFKNKAEEIFEYIVAQVCSDGYVSEFTDYLIAGDLDKQIDCICTISRKQNYWSFDAGIFSNEIKTLMHRQNSHNHFLLDILKFIKSSETSKGYAKNIDHQNVMLILQENAYWITLAVAVRKCLPNKEIKCDWHKLHCHVSEKCPSAKDACMICTSTFDNAHTYYNRKNLPHLDLMLHRRHSYKKPRTQKKQISRVYKRAKKIMLFSQIHTKKNTYFAKKQHMLPELFVTHVRSECFA